MACFLVPMAQAVVTTVIRKKSHGTNPWLSQLPKLELMLWGGSAMLIIDHIINGELMWKFPFFSALQQSGGIATMLREMLTAGLPMSLCVTIAYFVMVALCWRRCQKLSRHES